MRAQSEQKRIPLDFAVNSIKLINGIPELNAEPLYDITGENIGKLREILDAPFASFDGIERRSTLEEKAVVIFAQPFADTNLLMGINVRR